MKKITLVTLLFASSLVIVKAQTAEEIVKTYIENIGGEEALRGVKNIRMKANIDAQGMIIPLTVINTVEGKMLTKIELQGKEIVQQAFDGETAWGVNFMTQNVEKSDAEDTENIKRQIQDFPEVFLDYEKKGYKIELLGKETVEGVECFKMKLTKKPILADGEEVENVNFYFFDTENLVPIAMEAEIKSGQMKGSISQTVFSDYQEIGGIYFPFSIDQRLKDSGQGQPVTWDSIELNIELDETMFEFVEPTSEPAK